MYLDGIVGDVKKFDGFEWFDRWQMGKFVAVEGELFHIFEFGEDVDEWDEISDVSG